MSAPGLPAFAPPAGAVVKPRCPACRQVVGELVWGAVLRCRRCKTRLLIRAGQGIHVVAEDVPQAA